MRNSILKGGGIYVVSSVLSSAIPFLLLPLLTRALTPQEYGQVTMYLVFVSLLTALIGINAHSASERYFFEVESKQEIKQYNGSCLVVYLISLLIVFLLVYLFRYFVAEFLGVPIVWLYIAVVNAAAIVVINFRLGQWQVRKSPLNYAFLQIFFAAANALVSILFVLYFDLGGEGRIGGIVVSAVVVLIIAVCLIARDKLLSFSWSKTQIISILNFGVPLVPHLVGALLLQSFDRIFLNDRFGSDIAGIYMVAVTLSGVLNVIFHSLNKAYTPFLYGILNAESIELKSKVVRGTYIYFLFLVIAGLVGFFVSPYVLKLIVGSSFYQAAEVIGILVVGQVFLGMYLMVTNYIFYAKKTKYIAVTTMLSGVSNITLLFVLVGYCDYGMIGAAYANAISCLVLFILTWMLSAKAYKMPWFYLLTRNTF